MSSIATALSANVKVFSEKNLTRDYLMQYIHSSASSAIESTGKFSLVLSGGSQVDLLNDSAFHSAAGVDYEKWCIFLADERCVSIEDAESTYGSMQRQWGADCPLLAQSNFAAPITPALLASGPEAAAAAYSAHLHQLGCTAFDVVLLGMGPDGHTASLFPPVNSEMVESSSSSDIVRAVFNSPKPPPERITMSLPLLLAASQQIFVITKGAAVAPVLKRILVDNDITLPLALLTSSKKVVFCIDDVAEEAMQR